MMKVLNTLIYLVSYLLSVGSVACQDSDDTLNAYFIYDLAEVQPVPIGGYPKLYEAIASILKYPATHECVEGKVYVGFVVEKDGSVTKFEVIKSIHPIFDDEAIRTLKEVFKVTKYIPGTIDEIPVRVKMILPIYFKI